MFVVDSGAIVLVSWDDTHTFLFPACTATTALPPPCTILHGSPPQRFMDLKAEVILKRKRWQLQKLNLTRKQVDFKMSPTLGGEADILEPGESKAVGGTAPIVAPIILQTEN